MEKSVCKERVLLIYNLSFKSSFFINKGKINGGGKIKILNKALEYILDRERMSENIYLPINKPAIMNKNNLNNTILTERDISSNLKSIS